MQKGKGVLYSMRSCHRFLENGWKRREKGGAFDGLGLFLTHPSTAEESVQEQNFHWCPLIIRSLHVGWAPRYVYKHRHLRISFPLLCLFKHEASRIFHRWTFETQGKIIHFPIVVWDYILFYFFIFCDESVRNFPEQQCLQLYFRPRNAALRQDQISLLCAWEQ